jgi:hypothetical protein
MPKKYGMKLFLFILIFMIFANFTFANAATVRFYDDSLNLLETKNYKVGSKVNFTQIKGVEPEDITFWYIAGGYLPIDNHTVIKDINFYSVPQVKEIETENELEDIRNSLGGGYILLNDIKLTEAWGPIGIWEKPFSGVFNGGGYTISGLWVDNTSINDFVGLFGRTYGAVIKNVKVSIDVEKGSFSGRSHVGAIVGSAVNTTITNSHSEGFVKGGIIVGGIVGASIHTTIERSSSTSNIEAYACAGGVVGLSIYSNLKRVSSSGTIILQGDSVNLADIYQEGLEYNIFLDYERYIGISSMEELRSGLAGGLTGGITGYSKLVTIADSHFSGMIEGKDYTGGIAGYIDGYFYHGDDDKFQVDSVISNSYVVGNINGRDNTGGIAGEIDSGEVRNSHFDGKIKGLKGVGGIAGVLLASNLVNSYAQGEVEGESNVGGLVGLSYDMISQNFFNGNVKGVDSVGGVVGYNITGGISDSYSEGTVYGENAVGGLVGKLTNDYSAHAVVMSSYSSAKVTGKENVGGIAGYTKYIPADYGDIVYINDVYFTGSIKGGGKYTGGIVGYNEGFVFRAYALGSVEGGEYVGGIAGYTTSEKYDYEFCLASHFPSHGMNYHGIVPTVNECVAANSVIKGKNTARVVAFIDGEQESVPNNFALSTLNKGFTRFSEGDAYTGISKNEEELKQGTTYFSVSPKGLGWIYGDCGYHVCGILNKNKDDTKLLEKIKEKIKDFIRYNDFLLNRWTMEGSTTGYPIFYWQLGKDGREDSYNNYEKYCY